MKVSIGFNYTTMPYGGGNSFVKNLCERLTQDGHHVVHTLQDNDIDIILLINPLKTSERATFNNVDIEYYLNFINENAISFQRFNDCDERKDSKNINSKLIKKNKPIDINLFVSSWLKDIFRVITLNKPSEVILGGPDRKIFNQVNKSKWNKQFPIKLVTHHWSNHKNKGYETYQYIDKLLEREDLKNKVEFTLIGNIPSEYNFRNTKLIPPLSSKELSTELKKNNIYITASKNEPSGNHHMEAALTGLPILYLDSGGVTEYCKNYGLSFTEENFLDMFEKLIEDFEIYSKNLETYPYDFEYVYKSLISIFNNSIINRKEIIRNRTKSNKFNIFIKHYFYKFILYVYKKFLEFKIFVVKLIKK